MGTDLFVGGDAMCVWWHDSFHYLEVLLVHTTKGDGIAAEVKDELTVAVDADDVALVAGEGAGEDAEEDMVLGKLHEGVAQEGDLVGMARHDVHERAHHLIRDGGRTSEAAVVDQMIVGKIVGEEVT